MYNRIAHSMTTTALIFCDVRQRDIKTCLKLKKILEDAGYRVFVTNAYNHLFFIFNKRPGVIIVGNLDIYHLYWAKIAKRLAIKIVSLPTEQAITDSDYFRSRIWLGHNPEIGKTADYSVADAILVWSNFQENQFKSAYPGLSCYKIGCPRVERMLAKSSQKKTITIILEDEVSFKNLNYYVHSPERFVEYNRSGAKFVSFNILAQEVFKMIIEENRDMDFIVRPRFGVEPESYKSYENYENCTLDISDGPEYVLGNSSVAIVCQSSMGMELGMAGMKVWSIADLLPSKNLREECSIYSSLRIRAYNKLDSTKLDYENLIAVEGLDSHTELYQIYGGDSELGLKNFVTEKLHLIPTSKDLEIIDLKKMFLISGPFKISKIMRYFDWQRLSKGINIYFILFYFLTFISSFLPFKLLRIIKIIDRGRYYE